MKAREPAGQAAYAELILTLVDARADPATTRFDHELAAAVTAGCLDEQTARTLRWWQRESVRGVRDHLADVLPPLLDALESAAVRTAATVQASEELFRTALSQANAPTDVSVDADANTDDETTTDTTTQSAHDDESRPVVLSLPIDLTDRRRRMVVAGLVAASDSATPRGSSREGRR